MNYLLISIFLMFSQPNHSTLQNVDKIAAEDVTPVEEVTFTLRNNTMKSIPLIIPGVMNPNLSPRSNSGVGLRVGQKIYFLHNKKKVELLTVTKELEGKTIKVGKLISKIKAEM
ncbi:MAG: hypothetical protein AAFY71_26695 [Bacteroidota bacterium]